MSSDIKGSERIEKSKKGAAEGRGKKKGNTMERAQTSNVPLKDQLLKACQSGDTEMINELVTKQFDPLSFKFEKKMTLLHISAKFGQKEAVRHLVTKYNFSVDDKDQDGNTPLLLAVSQGHRSVVLLLLLELDASKYIQNNSSHNYIAVAVINGQIDVFHDLMKFCNCDPHMCVSYGKGTPLHIACEYGNLDFVKMLLTEYYCDPKARDDKGITPLHVAAQNGMAKVAELLISKYNCYAKQPDVNGNSPMHYAAMEGHSGMIELLSKFGGVSVLQNKKGETAIFLAAQNGHHNAIKYLISKLNCDPNMKLMNGRTILHYACEGGFTNLVSDLISKYKCDCSAIDEKGLTPLHTAVSKGRKEVATVLVSRFKCSIAVLDDSGNTPLHTAVVEGQSCLVHTLLLELGADLLHKNSHGQTSLDIVFQEGYKHHDLKDMLEFLLHYACENASQVMVRKIIVDFNYDTMARDSQRRIPLHIAALKGRDDIVKLLVDGNNCLVYILDNYKNSPLHMAAIGGHIGVINVLLSIRKDISTLVNMRQSTALHIAVLNGHCDILNTLIKLDNSCLYIRGYNNRTPLHYASEGGFLAMVELLISKYCCNPNIQDCEGLTPLHIAAACGKERIVKYLVINHCCFIHQTDNNHNTPLHYAMNEGHYNIVRFLVTQMVNDLAIAPLKSKHIVAKHHCDLIYIHHDIHHLLMEYFQDSLISEKVVIIDSLKHLYDYNPMAKNREGKTLLHVAASFGEADLVNYIVSEFRCAINMTDHDGNTPLHIAAAAGHRHSVTILIELKADMKARNKKNDTPLNLAAINGHHNVVAVFVAEFDCNPGSEMCRTLSQLLHQACKCGHLQLVEMLIDNYKCDFMLKDEDGLTLLHVAVKYGRNAIVMHLVTKCKCNLDCTDNSGNTPLHLVSQNTTLRLLLMELGGNIKLKNWQNQLAREVVTYHCRSYLENILPLACKGGHVEIVDRLISECKYDPAAYLSPSLLHIASLCGHVNVVKLLIKKYNCIVDVVNCDGDTPLHLAAKRGHSEVIRVLLSQLLRIAAITNKMNNTALHEAAINGHANAVSVFLDEFMCNPQTKYFKKRPLIYYACSGDNLKLIKRLIPKHGYSSIRDSEGFNLLHMAASKGKIAAVKCLINRYKFSLESTDDEGNTALHLAANGGHISIIRMLMHDYNANIKAKNNKNKLPVDYCTGNSHNCFTPLHYACENGVLELMDMLISKRKWDIMGIDREWRTPLHLAAKFNRIEVVNQLVLIYKCPINCTDNKGNTPLHLAAMEGHSLVVQFLMNHGADGRSQNKENNTALHTAAIKGKTEVIRILVDDFPNQCNPHLKGNNGRTLLHHACTNGHIELVDELVSKYHCNMDTVDKHGYGLLHIAATTARCDMIKYLAKKHDISPDKVDDDGNTALHLAVKKYDTAVVRILLREMGANVNVKNKDGKIPLDIASYAAKKELLLLHKACEDGELKLVQRLIGEHYDLEARDEKGRTPLHMAALTGRSDVVKLLHVDHNCSLENTDMDKNTSLHMAAIGGHCDLVQEMLINYIHKERIQLNSVLHVAAMNGHSDIVNLLIGDPLCSVESIDHNGRTLLHQTCGSGNRELMERFIHEYRCDILAKDSNGCNLIHVAASKGQDDIIECLVNKYSFSVDSKDNNGNTPLHLAAKGGHLTTVRLLVFTFGANVNGKNNDDKLPVDVSTSASLGPFICLHEACARGNIDEIEKLIYESKCYPLARDKNGRIPLHYAAGSGKDEVVRQLFTKFGCPTDSVNYTNNEQETALHVSARCGHCNVVRVLLSEFKADIMASDKMNSKPIHVAARYGKIDVVEVLVKEFHCSINAKGFNRRIPLHYACAQGYLSLVQLCIDKYRCEHNARDREGLTPLHMAAWCNQERVIRELVNKYNCSIEEMINNGETVLYLAIHSKISRLVRVLIADFEADVNILDYANETPLHYAAKMGSIAIVSILVKEFDVSVNAQGFSGRTALHCACSSGNVELVEMLIHSFKCNPLVTTSEGCTPLQVAAEKGKLDVAKYLVQNHKCSVTCSDVFCNTPLHSAAKEGHCNIVRMLRMEKGVDVNARNMGGYTPLSLAVLYSQSSVVKELGKLHDACKNGDFELIKKLISNEMYDPMAEDDEKHTPMHLAVQSDKAEIVQYLLVKCNCSVESKDENGRSPLDYAAVKGKEDIFKILLNHSEWTRTATKKERIRLLQLSQSAGNHGIVVILMDKFPGLQNDVTDLDIYKDLESVCDSKLLLCSRVNVFVIGNKQVGKSSLIEAIKSTKVMRFRIQDVPPHTTGIVPNEFNGPYGRVTFYDFAGDEEFYSSHAAILERVLREQINIFLIVYNISELYKNKENGLRIIHYWLTFLSYMNTQSIKKVILVGSHADKLKRKDEATALECVANNVKLYPDITIIGKFALNCLLICSDPLVSLRRIFWKACFDATESKHQQIPLRIGAKFLLGVLQKEFKDLVACDLKKILEHIKSKKLQLSSESKTLYSYLEDLHAIGAILLIGNCNIEESLVIINICKLVSTINGKLFEKDKGGKFKNIPSKYLSKCGILPHDCLQSMFDIPFPIVKDCLVLLQFCHEISKEDIFSLQTKSDIHEEVSSENKYLFCPVILEEERRHMWSFKSSFPEKHPYFGWFAQCGEGDYFLFRFLHLLLLRLAYNFAQPSTNSASDTKSESPVSFDAIQDATKSWSVWKNGIYWKTKECVEVMVEVVEQRTGVLVMVRGAYSPKANNSSICATALMVAVKVVQEIVRIKNRCCDTLKATTFFVLPKEDIHKNDDFVLPCLSNLRLVEMKHVNDLLESEEENVNTTTEEVLYKWDITFLEDSRCWKSLFSVTTKQLLKYLDDIVGEWWFLGIQLGIKETTLRTIKSDNNNDVQNCKIGMLQVWQSDSSLHPSWHQLVQALTEMNEYRTVEKIKKDINVEVDRKLTDPNLSEELVDDKFLEELAKAMGLNWQNFALHLDFSPQDIQTFTQSGGALGMLRKLVNRCPISYGELQKLLRSNVFLKPTL